jgi:hypothetical protein
VTLALAILSFPDERQDLVALLGHQRWCRGFEIQTE